MIGIMNDPLLHAFILSLLPISELRGGIPYAVASGVSLPIAYLLCVAANILVIPIVYIFLETLHKWFYGIGMYRKVFDRIVERTRRKAERNVKKYGYWGVMLFVAIPLPITGAYSGTLAAWLLKLDKKRSFWYLTAGVLIAGVVVSIATISGLKILQVFTK